MHKYEHTEKVHSFSGPRVGIQLLFEDFLPNDLLDVGCGLGTWMQAAIHIGVKEVWGIEGNLSENKIPEEIQKRITRHDLTKQFDLGKTFDTALCLEVAEHLPEESAITLISSLCNHSEKIYFSAACPNQHGQNHINCQWPSYWQKLFNDQGYACSDKVRWIIWDMTEIEPWYRQNIFLATKDEKNAGYEKRLHSVIHPDMIPYLSLIPRDIIENGSLPVSWYLSNLWKSTVAKMSRQKPWERLSRLISQ